MTEAHTTRAHARLAPSAAHRWINCPGSVRATADLPDSTSNAAAEGTAAHELCAHCLSTGDDPATFLDMWIDIQAEDGAGRFVELDEEPDEALRFFPIDEEMVDGVQMYLEHVRSLLPSEYFALEVEQRLDMTHLHPQIFGTGDATVLDHAHQHLHVIDFKYGKGIAVEADENPQLLLYAAGAARRHHNAKVANLTIHVVQPRAPHAKGPIRTYDIDLLDLFEFEATLAIAAAETDKPDAAFHAGDWCSDGFCKIQASCPANRAFRLAAAGAEFGTVDVETKFPALDEMTDEQEEKVLREADGLLAYVKAVQQRAHDRATQGRPPRNFKLVAKRANRKWIDPEAARAKMLELAIEPYQPAKLKSPAMAEPGFPGKNKDQRQAAMAELVIKKSSGTNLVPIEDPRPAVNVGAGADFEAVADAA